MKPRFPILSSDQIIKALRKAGFEYAPKRGKGSHIALVKIDNNRKRLVIIPKNKNLPRGTCFSIIDQAGLTRNEFLDLL